MYKLIKTYVVKTWDELSDEEKEQEKEKNRDLIAEAWQEQLQEDFEEELSRAASGAVQFAGKWYNSIDVQEYGTSYFLRDNVKNINFNIDSFSINDVYFESDGKKLVKYNDLKKKAYYGRRYQHRNKICNKRHFGGRCNVRGNRKSNCKRRGIQKTI